MKPIICSIVFGLTFLVIDAFAIGGEPQYLEAGLQGRNDIIFFGGFEEKPCTGDWQTSWATSYIQGCNRMIITEDESSFQNTKSLKFTYEKGLYGSGCKLQWPSDFTIMPNIPDKTYDSLHFRYYVKFESGFDFKKGGKLPGLMSVNGNGISGGAQPDGTNGWTVRYMFSSGGRAVIYCYLPEGFKYAGGAWGKTIGLNHDGYEKYFQPGKWHCIEQFVKLNSIGKQDGKLHVWFDGKLALKLDDVTYRTVNNEKGRIGGIYFSTFHGGGDNSYAPSKDCYAQFDNLVAAREYIGLYGENAGIRVNSKPDNIVIKNEPYSFQFEADGGEGEYSWRVTEGTLPSGLSMSLRGRVEGISMASVGKYPVTIEVKDEQGAILTVKCIFVVEDISNVNMANKTTVIAHSDNFSGSNTVNGLWDGDFETNPSGFPGNSTIDSFWVEFDLGKVRFIKKSRLFGDAQGSWVSKNYSILIKSEKNDNYRKIVNNDDCFGDEWFENEKLGNARYVKLVVIGDTLVHKTQVREFEVYVENGITKADIVTEKNKPISNLTVVKSSAGKLILSWPGVSNDPVKVNVTDMSGRLVKINNWKIDRENGISTASVITRNIAGGIYNISIKAGNKTMMVRSAIVNK